MTVTITPTYRQVQVVQNQNNVIQVSAQGPIGQGVPTGGTANQLLTKVNGTDYNTTWADLIESQIPALSIAKTTGLQTALDGKQPLDADLTAIAALTPADGDIIQRVSSAWVNRTMAQLYTSLGLGTIATQNANNVAISGGSINGTPIGATTPSSGAFTSAHIGSGAIDSNLMFQIRSSVPSVRLLSTVAANNWTGVGFVPQVGTDILFALQSFTTGVAGGAVLNGFSDGSAPSFTQIGYLYSTTPVAPAILFTGFKSNGSNSRVAIAGTELVLQIQTGINTSYRTNTPLLNLLANGNLGLSVPANSIAAKLHVAESTSGTNNTVTTTIIGLNSSNTPAASFASRMLFQLKSSTMADQDAASIRASWNVATHASREGDLILSAHYAGTEREGLRIRGGSSAVQLAFYGGTPRSQPNLGAWAGLTTDQKLDALRDALAGAAGLNLVTYS